MTQRIGTVKPKSFIGTSALVKELHGTQAINGTAPRNSGVVSSLPGGNVVSDIVFNSGGNIAGLQLMVDGTIETVTANVTSADTVTGQTWFTGTPDQAYQAYFEVSGFTSFVGGGAPCIWRDIPCQITAENTGGNSSASITFRILIRRKSDGFLVATSSADYTASCTSSDLPG